ncbi:hypothetical protein SAMN05421847_3027 [Halpernia humi]|uniref:Uncharacterized protein n=1 Tax=Halpernia humi TaxID=493375 RepID=A0A1H6BQW7_9FLAO|nr:hypothetical protein [Halpernia humi]SEG63050.1 hypothetical protein SAMN05421847_3027 [Halpernia humi]
MNKFFTFLIILIFPLTSCKKEIENIQNKTLDSNSKTQPQFLTFIFQPSLNENAEVNVNFEKKYLTFKTIYPFLQEPPAFGEKKTEKKPPKPYYAELTQNQINELTKILVNLNDEDYQQIQGNYIDGISYNFSILNSDKTFKVGYIANEKTENQKKLTTEILNLVSETNKFEENFSAISYYGMKN